MNNIADKTTFWIFLGQTYIVIPKLQRDYAQGRKGKESIRENFLYSIKNALDSESKQLKLDFVYGTSDNGGNFTPLDGQQRLTTLWLLHWYLAFRIGALNDKAVKERLLRFTYETRISSRQFCEKLVNRGNEISLTNAKNISDAIMRQSWMFKAWRQDPTIQAMLRMLSGEENNKLDGIEEVFSECGIDQLKTYWDKLQKSAEECPIVFYSLDIENIGQSDDLYVKMNGRGKPLNDFENFKADLIKFCEDNKWEEFTNIKTGLPTLIDTSWINLFWQYRTNIPTDTLLFRFINRFFLTQWMATKSGIEEAAKKDSELKSVFDFLYSYIEKEEKPYNEIGFKAYKYLFTQIDARSTLNLLVSFLNRICANRSLMDAVNNPYDASIFKILYTESSDKNSPNFYSITQQQLIAFWAVGKYITSSSDVNADAISKWMRVIWNICDYNNEFRDKTAVNTTIYILNSIFSSSGKFKEELSSLDINNTKSLWNGEHLTILGEHLLEEQVKLKKISEGAYNGSLEQFIGCSWEEVITHAEKLSFVESNVNNFIVSGNLRCLLRDESGEYTWENFDKKYTHLSHYISENLDSITYRNYLRTAWNLKYENNIAKLAFWYGCTPSTLSLHLKFWRDIFSKSENYIIKLVHHWLNSDPLTADSLREDAEAHYAHDYVKHMMLGSSLIKDSYDKQGIYLTHSAKFDKWVLFHHQNQYTPYVVFNLARNTELINSEGITVKNQETILPCGMLNGRNIEFTYLGKDFIWTADDNLYLTEDKDLNAKHLKYRTDLDFKEQLNQIIEAR